MEAGFYGDTGRVIGFLRLSMEIMVNTWMGDRGA